MLTKDLVISDRYIRSQRQVAEDEEFVIIYPSQRQNLPPALEIVIRNFQNLQKNPKFRIFSQNF